MRHRAMRIPRKGFPLGETFKKRVKLQRIVSASFRTEGNVADSENDFFRVTSDTDANSLGYEFRW